MGVYTNIFESFPVLKTNRLTLRSVQLKDAPEILSMRNNGRINEFIPRKPMKEVAESEDLIKDYLQRYDDHEAISWAGILDSKDEIIGTCGFRSLDIEKGHAEIGGELCADYWGKNLAYEAVRAIVDFGFKNMQLKSIEARISPDNRGAIYLIGLLGFRRIDLKKNQVNFEGKNPDMAIYRLVKN